MIRIICIFLCCFTLHAKSADNGFALKIFERILHLPSSCVWDLSGSLVEDQIGLFECNAEGYPVVTIVEKLNPQKLEDIKVSTEIVDYSERYYKNIKHYDIEGLIEHSDEYHRIYIDLLCDETYCITILAEGTESVVNYVLRQVK